MRSPTDAWRDDVIKALRKRQGGERDVRHAVEGHLKARAAKVKETAWWVGAWLDVDEAQVGGEGDVDATGEGRPRRGWVFDDGHDWEKRVGG